MAGRLEGKRIAFLATDGVEQVELTEPWKAVKNEGGTPELVSIKSGEIQGVNHMDKGDTFKVDTTADKSAETPYRVARMYEEICEGLHKDPREFLKVVPDETHDEMVIVKDIPLYSICEHHLAPFH